MESTSFEEAAARVRAHRHDFAGGILLRELGHVTVIACEQCGDITGDSGDTTEWVPLCHQAMRHSRETGHQVAVSSWRGALYGRP